MNKQNNSKNSGKGSNNAKPKVKREQPRKDSRQKRVNYDNMREDKIKDISCTSKSNDVAWYAHNAELLRSAASLPFSSVTGHRFPWSNPSNISGSDAFYTSSVPGIMGIKWEISMGGMFNDALNQAKDSIYSFTVHANSRNTSYTSQDEMLVILAGASLFSAIAHGIRAYGTMKAFNQVNSYMPQGLIRAMGFDYDDLRNNLSQMWFDLNEMIARSAQIWIPNNLPFMERWFWMNSNIYMDGGSSKSQFYMYVPQNFWYYNELLNDNGGGLSYVTSEITGLTGSTSWSSAYSTPATWANYKAFVNKMFTALIDSEDRGLIFGDILKAYGSERIYALKPIPVDYTVVPVHDPEVLTQIENSNQSVQTLQQISQNQATGKLYSSYVNTYTTATMVNTGLTYKIINFHQAADPSPEQVMVATRMMSLGNYPIYNSAGKFVSIAPATCGTEEVAGYFFITKNWKDTLPKIFNFNPTDLKQGQTLGFQMVYNWSAFDWAPWINIVSTTGFQQGNEPSIQAVLNAETNPLAFIGDYEQWTVIDWKTLQKMHQTAIYSELGVPVI